MKTKCAALLLSFLLVLCLFAQSALAAKDLSLTTTLTGGGYSANGNMFDVTVTGGKNLVIDGFDINVAMSYGTPTVNVYYRPGSYTESPTSADGWILAGSASVIPSAIDTPTPLNIGEIRLKSGQTYGFYIINTNENNRLHYTPGTTAYSDDNMTISAGQGKFLPEFTGESYEPRIWSGTIYYHINEKTVAARRHEREHAFWNQVCALLTAAKDGGVVEAELAGISHMPSFVMRKLAEYPGVVLLLKYDGGEFSIPSEKALTKDIGTYFTLEELQALYPAE